MRFKTIYFIARKLTLTPFFAKIKAILIYELHLNDTNNTKRI